MKYIISMIAVLCILSCVSNKERIIHYSYNGVQVTRVDVGSVSNFYYGYCNNNDLNCPKESITVDWSFDNYLFGFIIFKNDSTVEIIDGGGGNYQKHYNADSKLILKKYNDTDISDNGEKDYINMFQLSNDLELERRRNKQFGSNVNVIYPH